jgi:hypothetical protein
MFRSFFLASFANHGVLNWDPTVWLGGGDRPANTCIPPAFSQNALAEPHGIPNPKSMFASTVKIAQKILKFGQK